MTADHTQLTRQEARSRPELARQLLSRVERLPALLGTVPLATEIQLFKRDLSRGHDMLRPTGETSFLETGTIGFGDGNQLHFSTVGSGYLAPSADPARKQGTVMWRIEEGTGQFAGASGLITSNFFVDEGLGVVDHHFGVLLLP